MGLFRFRKSKFNI